MAFCRNCGDEMAEGQEFCMKCGAQKVPSAETVDLNQEIKTEKKNEGLNVGMLVWSIINIALCNQIAGAIALIFTLLARDEEEVKAKRYNGYSKLFNIIGTALGVLAVIIVVIYFFFMFAMLLGLSTGLSSSMYY